MKSMRIILLFAVCILACGMAQAANHYSVTDIGWHPLYDTTANTLPNGINENGQIVGTSNRPASADRRAFLFSNGAMTNLGMLPGYPYSCTAMAINDNGVVVGYGIKSSTTGDPVRGFIYQNGSMEALGTLGGTIADAMDINNSNQIAGSSSIANDTETHAVIYENGALRDLGTLGGKHSYGYAINNRGEVVGYSRTSISETHAFLFRDGSMVDLGTFGGNLSLAKSINDRGEAVGFAYLAGNASYHSFLYSNWTMTDLGTFGGTYSGANDINEKGQVVGYSQVPGSIAHAFLYDNGVMMDLNNLIDPALGLTLHGANAITETGLIVAYGKFAGKNNNHAFLLTPIPESSTLVLLVVGAVSLLAYAWRRRRPGLYRPGDVF
ncbi:MAG: PEP-CTERM sorting domain-containing protein [Pirellulales bacterium]|nr:PEP-CTERM sorting domain-containing protein [Pirellulales bacterium]